jgi:hypothetical protein
MARLCLVCEHRCRGIPSGDASRVRLLAPRYAHSSQANKLGCFFSVSSAVEAYSSVCIQRVQIENVSLGGAAGPIRRGNSGITGAQTYQVAGSGSGSDRYRLRRRRRSGGRWSTADRHPHARHDVGRTNRHDDDTAANGADDKGCPGYDSDSSQRLLTQAAISSSSGGSWRKQH